MKRFKRIIIYLLMGVAGINLVNDFINLMNGYTYTWLGYITALIYVVIIGVALDILRG